MLLHRVWRSLLRRSGILKPSLPALLYGSTTGIFWSATGIFRSSRTPSAEVYTEMKKSIWSARRFFSGFGFGPFVLGARVCEVSLLRENFAFNFAHTLACRAYAGSGLAFVQVSPGP